MYPGSPFSRAYTCLRIYKSIIDIWGLYPIYPFSDKKTSPYTEFLQYIEYISKEKLLSPLILMSFQDTMILLHYLWDKYDSCRQLSFEILELFPNPLPGFETKEKIKEILQFGFKLIHSPRERECESGALLFLLVFKKYIRNNWKISKIENHKMFFSEISYLASINQNTYTGRIKKLKV